MKNENHKSLLPPPDANFRKYVRQEKLKERARVCILILTVIIAIAIILVLVVDCFTQ